MSFCNPTRLLRNATVVLALGLHGQAQFANPLFPGADPDVLVTSNTVWIYPTWSPGGAKQFYGFSSSNLVDWSRHGPILDFKDIPWINSDGETNHRAWAPSIIARNGTLYFYFSVGPQARTPSRIGVAVGKTPAGPFQDSGQPLLAGGDGFEAIDPMAFFDPPSGKYILYAGGSAGARLRVFELGPDLISLAREVPVETPRNFTEGAFMLYRRGKYYLSYSHGRWSRADYSVHYATADSPFGPWDYRGVILSSDATRKGPGHHAFFQSPFNGEWLMAYHRWNHQTGDGPFTGRRQICLERVEFGADGLIQPLMMTDRPPQAPRPPGVVIDHRDPASGLYIGSPSLVVLTNGDYLASHDLFGPKSNEYESPTTVLFRSRDHGQSWTAAGQLQPVFWANLFVHRGAVYLMGTDKHHGRIVIRRSTDAGMTWSDARDAQSGLLTTEGEYHTAPVPVVEHDGRLWRAFENAGGGTEWGKRYLAGMLSIPVDADLLRATNWTFSNCLTRDGNWLGGNFNGWLEGNAVVSPAGELLNILRVETPSLPERSALVQISADGRRATFDPATGFIEMPGGAKKFTIRFDPGSGLYWTLANICSSETVGSKRPATIRNTLALLSSRDLRRWDTQAALLHHPDTVSHGFQYVDWSIEDDDIIAVCRTAFDDLREPAHNYHDANYLTFHRWRNFRQLKD